MDNELRGTGKAMVTDSVKIPKKLKPVTLWVHPEGRVVGSLFVRLQAATMAEDEEPLEVLNRPDPFLVLQRNAPEEIRFYNKGSIIRVEYRETMSRESLDIEPLSCKLQMMDGLFIEGSIWNPLPPDRARLLDYFNLGGARFIKIDCQDDYVYLINKTYITCVTP